MPARRINIRGREWQVYPSGFLTPSVGDEHGLVFVSGQGADREIRVSRFSPRGIRAREQALAEMSDDQLRALFSMSQPGARSPEAGYQG